MMHTLHVDDAPNPCLNIQTHTTLISNSNPSSSISLPSDDWGTLDFNPTFIGEYKAFYLDFMKPQRDFEQWVFTSNALHNNFVATSIHNESVKLTNGDIVTNEVPLTPHMTSHYVPGYHFLVKQGFNGQACGKNKKGTQMPLQNGGISILMDWDLILNNK